MHKIWNNSYFFHQLCKRGLLSATKPIHALWISSYALYILNYTWKKLHLIILSKYLLINIWTCNFVIYLLFTYAMYLYLCFSFEIFDLFKIWLEFSAVTGLHNCSSWQCMAVGMSDWPQMRSLQIFWYQCF